MSLGADILSSKPVASLRELYLSEPVSPVGVADALNALGACAGFAAQVAVWRELILPGNRNPGDFLVYFTTPTQENLFFGEAINQFLFSTGADRLSFLSLGAGALANAAQLPDIGELARHVSQSVGSGGFGHPRVPPGVVLSELPQAALNRTWGRTAQILREHRAAEWPALLGAAAYTIIQANRRSVAPPLAVRILLEAAVPMSKLNPARVEGSGIPAPSFANWSMRALRPENNQAIVAEVRASMLMKPAQIAAAPPLISRPKIAFLNLAGNRYAAVAAQDRAIIGGLFDDNVAAVAVPAPVCDVLFLYCDLESSGQIVGQTQPLRQVISDSTAMIAVIAAQVPAELLDNREFQTAMTRNEGPPVNLVITNNRNGEKFSRFFKELFEIMRNGTSMPMAWVQLAPQGPVQRDDIPGTICLMGAGHVTFV